MFRSLCLDIGTKTIEHRLVEGDEVVARDRLTCSNGDVVAGIDGQYTAPHRAIMPRFIAALPAYDRDRQACQEIRMPGQYPEAAGGIFSAQREDSVFVDD